MPRSSLCPGCRKEDPFSPREGGEGEKREGEGHTGGGREKQACLLHPGAPSRPLSLGPQILRNLPHHGFIWAVEDPITYNKQFRLSLSESLSKLAT